MSYSPLILLSSQIRPFSPIYFPSLMDVPSLSIRPFAPIYFPSLMDVSRADPLQLALFR